MAIEINIILVGINLSDSAVGSLPPLFAISLSLMVDLSCQPGVQ